MVKKSQIIFMSGKEKALRELFSEKVFGYLAVGFVKEEDNGFIDPEEEPTSITDYGFNELADSNGYERVELYPVGTPEKDSSTGKVLMKFSATLQSSNISSGTDINQIAIVDNKNVGHADTKIYSATTFPTYNKSSDSSITFVIGFRY